MKKFEGMLLACDMDGTLLSSDLTISHANQQALRYFTEEGGRFMLSTGRAPRAIRFYLDQLPFNTPYSLLNGSLIMSEQHQVLRCAGMPEKTKELIDAVLSKFPQFGCEIFQGDQILIRQMSDVTAHHIEVLQLDYTPVTQQQLGSTAQWCKINFTGPQESMDALHTFLAPYSDRFCISSSMPTFCEITAHGVHKGSAMLAIAADCGIDKTNIYAVGDSHNDEMMLRAAQIGFVPKNAENAIRSIADVVVSDNDHNAVADAVKYIEAHLC